MSHHVTQSPAAAVPGAGADAAAVVGSWQLSELLGEGRWSRVYRARPRGLPPDAPADYAVKLVRADPVGCDGGVQRLQREALVAREVAHPNLTCILSAHLNRPPYYHVMPCLSGATAQAALEAVPQIPAPHALWIARQAAEALGALHQRGWLHSDIKPGNLFVARDGHTTVLDLGLARRLESAECRAARVVAGTLAYAAPESFEPLAELGPAADVYSLGVALYHLLTGRLPFAAATPSALIAAHLHEVQPDPRELIPHLPDRVARLLRRMLDKVAARRPPTVVLAARLADLEIDTFLARWAA